MVYSWRRTNPFTKNQLAAATKEPVDEEFSLEQMGKTELIEYQSKALQQTEEPRLEAVDTIWFNKPLKWKMKSMTSDNGS